MAKYLYGYHEERGFADLYVTDVNGNTVWEVHYPSFYESNGEMLEDTTVFEDGFMKNADDIEGLEKYLKSISVINRGDELVDRDEDMYDDDEDDEYAAGGTIESKIKKRLKNAFELPIQIAVYVPSTRDKDIIIPKREMEARVEEVQRFLANAFGGFSAVKVEGGFESSDKGLIQEDAVRVVAFASKENENGVPFEKSFESLMNQVKNWCSKWSQQSIGVEFENDLFYVDTETKFADGGEVEDEVYNAYVVWIDDNDEAFFDGGWWSIEDAEDRVSDIEMEEEGKPKYVVFAVEYDEDYFENKNWDITRMKSYKPYPLTRMAKGGEVDLSPYKDIQKLNMLYKSGSKWYAWGKKYNVETKGEGYTKKEALKDLDNHLSYVSEDDEFADGGDIAESNLQMLRSNAKAIKHHAEELEGELNDDTEVEAWVVAKGERAATDLSDITHYLDGKEFSLGGMTAGRWYRDNSGEEFKFIGKVDSGQNKGRFLFSDGKKSVYKDLEDFEGGGPKETKLFGFFEDGGDLEEGVDLFEDYDEMPASVLETLSKYDLESGDYRELEKALKDLKKYGYTFEYELDGQPYDLRKIGQKGKSEFYAKGGSIKSLEKRVAEVNELIKRGNELGIEVVDESTTWQAPMKYKPLKYTNGVLYVSYEQLDLYKYNREYVQDWEKKSYKIGKYESGYGYRGEAGAAQREALTEIARMYRKPLKSYDTYGYFEDGGEVNKVNPEEIKVKIEQILDKVVPSFYKGVSIHKNIFDTGNNIRIFIAASDYKINGVSGQLPQVVSLSLDLSDMDLHPQVYGGNGGQRVERKPNMSDPNEKYLAMKGVKVPFRTPQPNEKAVLDAIRRFAENYKKTLSDNREVLLYQDIVDYDKLLAGSQYSDGGMMAEGGEVEKRVNTLYSRYDFINDDFNWRLKLLEMLGKPSYEAYEIYQSLNNSQKKQVLQELYEMDNDMGSDGDGDIETSKENLEILLDDSKNAKPKLEKGGYMADGGNVSPKEKMIKELQKLQRELNSSRLSQYREGDNSEQEMARQRERDSKLARFNEILEVLNEDKKMAKGGMFEHGLRTNDKIIGGKTIGTTILVENANDDERARIDLNTGKRTVLTYNKKLRKWEDADGKTMAKGGVIASSPTKEGIEKLIGDYYYSKNISLKKLDDKDEYEVSNSKGKINGVKVVVKRGRYQFINSDKMARGGIFAEGVKAIEKRLVGTKVNPKYQKQYGKTYDKAEAHEAASKIKGKMRALELAKKYKKKK